MIDTGDLDSCLGDRQRNATIADAVFEDATALLGQRAVVAEVVLPIGVDVGVVERVFEMSARSNFELGIFPRRRERDVLLRL